MKLDQHTTECLEPQSYITCSRALIMLSISSRDTIPLASNFCMLTKAMLASLGLLDSQASKKGFRASCQPRTSLREEFAAARQREQATTLRQCLLLCRLCNVHAL